MKRSVFRTCAWRVAQSFLLATALALSACSGGGSGGKASQQPPQGGGGNPSSTSNWDSLRWDQDNWA